MIVKVIDAYMLDNNCVDDVFYEDEDGKVMRYKIALFTTLRSLEEFKNKYSMFRETGHRKIRLTIEDVTDPLESFGNEY